MKWILLFCLFSPVAFAQKGSEVVATVGSRKITVDELNKKYAEVTAQVLANKPSKKLFLEDLIRYEVGVQEAKKRGVEKDPAFVERYNQELYKLFLERELGQKVQSAEVTEEDMKAWYSKNPQIRISDILIEVKPVATDEQRAEAKKRANEILAEVQKSKRPFEELAKLYSDDITTKNIGGDIGWQSRISVVPEYYSAALKLKIGEITPQLVETPFGFHIFKLTAKSSYKEATKRDVRMAVFDEKRKALFDQLFEKLKKQYTINVNSKLID